MTFRRFETFIIVAIIGVIGVVYALQQEPIQKIAVQTPVEQSENQQTNQDVQLVAASSIKYKGQEGKTALELLKTMHQVQTKEFTGIGEFVESIDGVQTDSKTNFWSFYVNGRQSPVGAGEYKTKDSDEIEWKIETIEY